MWYEETEEYWIHQRPATVDLPLELNVELLEPPGKHDTCLKTQDSEEKKYFYSVYT
jgi:hypothetical protein